MGRCVSQGAGKSCPIAGCDAPLQRTRGVVRDDALRERLLSLPAHVETVWLRGDEVRTQRPGAPRPASCGRAAAGHQQHLLSHARPKRRAAASGGRQQGERPRQRHQTGRKRQRTIELAGPSTGRQSQRSRRGGGGLALDSPLVLD